MGFKRSQKGVNELKGKIREAFGSTMGVLNQEFDDVIESEVAFADLGFNGQDIVDTGRFLDSKVISGSQDMVRWEWNPRNPDNGYQYAAALYAGFMAFGKKYVPGRPWTDRAIENVNLPEWLNYELDQMGIKSKFEIF